MRLSPCDPALPPYAGRLRRLEADLETLRRRWPVEIDPERGRMILDRVAAERSEPSPVWADLTPQDQVDAWLLKITLDRLEAEVSRTAENLRPAQEAIPALGDLVELMRHRPQGEPLAPSESARRIASLTTELQAWRESASPSNELRRNLLRVWSSLQKPLEEFRDHYLGYSPDQDFWIQQPLSQLLEEIAATQEFLVPASERDQLRWIGQPLGEAELQREISLELLGQPLSALLELAEREWAWCRAEMDRCARDLGVDSWLEAVERVKHDHVPVGHQIELVRELCQEAIDYVREHDLVTLPDLAHLGWRLQRISPERQREAPFLLGGESVWVAVPTPEMPNELKRMVLRSNNRSFTRAVAHHELIPGHHLQGFFMRRCHAHRSPWATPFWIEGWTLSWELLLWERGFARSAADRVGMLFWRSHRCARILFSLNFHLGQWTAEESVSFLVEQVGHEPSTAEAEVRRSFAGDYPPLYQAAYLLGGLQMHALRREYPGSLKEFHDAVLQQNAMPIALLRHLLRGIPISESEMPTWDWPELGASRG